MAETSISGIEFKIVGSTGKAKTSVDKLTSSLKGLKTALGSARTAKLEKELEGIDKNAKKSTTTLGKLFKSVGRIGFYRAIRSALKFITDGFREGLQNAYQFSKVVGYDLAGTMDNLATKTLTMKNQLGSAFGSLLQTLEPILIQIISFVTKAANAFAQLFAIIGGRKTYLKAVDTMTQYGEAVGGVGQAAKEAMRYLAPFDELNVLPSQNEPGGGGGGASTPDYSQMFEVTDVDADSILGSLANMFNDMADWFEAQDWKSLGSSVWKGLKEAFSDEGKADDVVRALFRTIGAVSGSVVGFAWGFISEAVEDIMKSFKDSIRDYNGDNKIGITDILTGIWNFAISPFVWIDENIVKPFWRGFTGALLGEEREPLTINDVLGKLPTNQEWIDWGKNVWKKIKEGIDSGWKSIKEGWADFKTELYNIFIKPIVDAFDAFAENHPKIAKLLGIENGASDVLAPGEAAAESMWGGTVELDAEVTNVKDSIPAEKRTLKDFLADLFGTKDDIPESEKKVSGVKALFGSTDGTKLTIGQKIVNGVKAAFGSTDGSKLTLAQKAINGIKALFGSTDPSGLTTAQKTVPAIAKLGSYVREFASGIYNGDKKLPFITSVARLGQYIKDFGAGTYNNNKKQPYIPSIAQLGQYIKDFGSGTYNNDKKKPYIPSVAQLYQYIKDFGAGTYNNDRKKPYIPSIAQLGQYIKDFKSGTYENNKKQPYIPSIAQLGQYIKNFGSGTVNNDKKTPKIDSQVNFTSGKDSLTADQKTFGSTAKFNTWEDNLGNVWSYAKAWFNQYNGSDIQDWNNPWMWTYGIARLNDWDNWINDTPEIKVDGRITYAYPDPDLQTPTIDVNARITGSLGNYTMETGGAFYGNRWHGIPQAAFGGKFHGTLFWAGEAGPEVVGHAGGRTEVLNRSQLAATMYAAVKSAMSGFRFNVSSMNAPSVVTDSYDEEMIYRAMLRALNDSDVFPDEIDLDGDVVYRKMVQRNQMNTRMTGRNVMATA